MPPVFETVVATQPATAVVTTITFAADPSQSLQIRSANGSPCAYIIDAAAQVGGACDLTIHSPRMHDNVAGLKWRAQGALATPGLLEGLYQPMYSQDTPTVQGIFAAAPNAVENLTYSLYYPDLPGSAPLLASYAQVMAQAKQWWTPNGGYLGVRVSPVTSATAGQLGAGVAFTSTENNFKANSWYALLGWNNSVICASVVFQGTDTGNLKTGGPGSLSPIETRRWFVHRDQVLGVPSIPVFNSANAAGTLVFANDIAGGTTIPIDLFFVYLGPSAAGLPF